MTSIRPPRLRDVMRSTVIIVVGRRIRIDMIDSTGAQTTGHQGPGEDNHMRSHVLVTRIAGGRANVAVGDVIIVPVWRMWHAHLDAAHDVTDPEEALYLLANVTPNRYGEVTPACAPQPSWPLSDEAEAVQLLNSQGEKAE